MANITITNNDTGNVLIRDGHFRHDQLLVFAGADTFAAGTILAFKSVTTAVTASAVTGTGNGTVTAASVAAGPTVPLVGVYTLTVVTAVTHGGVWRLNDPNGAIVEAGLTMTAGAGAATVFEVGGLLFTITDGSTDFVAGDTATLTVASLAKWVPFEIAGEGGEQVARAVLTYAVTKDGAGDETISVLTGGVVDFTRLIIDADGDNSNVTEAHLESLRDYGIFTENVQQLADLDNQ